MSGIYRTYICVSSTTHSYSSYYANFGPMAMGKCTRMGQTACHILEICIKLQPVSQNSCNASTIFNLNSTQRRPRGTSLFYPQYLANVIINRIFALYKQARFHTLLCILFAKHLFSSLLWPSEYINMVHTLANIHLTWALWLSLEKDEK